MFTMTSEHLFAMPLKKCYMRRTFMKRKILTILCCIALTAFIPGCNSKKYEEEFALAVEQTDIFEGGDIDKINSLLFPERIEETADIISEDFGSPTSDNSSNDIGILGKLFSLSIIEVSDVTDSKITYDITAPDLTDFFVDCYEELSMVTKESEFADILLEYANGVDTKATTIMLEYEYVDGVFSVNYRNKDFIDAMTGGLVTAYTNLYQEMIAEYREVLGQ